MKKDNPIVSRIAERIHRSTWKNTARKAWHTQGSSPPLERRTKQVTGEGQVDAVLHSPPWALGAAALPDLRGQEPFLSSHKQLLYPPHHAIKCGKSIMEKTELYKPSVHTHYNQITFLYHRNLTQLAVNQLRFSAEYAAIALGVHFCISCDDLLEARRLILAHFQTPLWILFHPPRPGTWPPPLPPPRRHGPLSPAALLSGSSSTPKCLQPSTLPTVLPQISLPVSLL